MRRLLFLSLALSLAACETPQAPAPAPYIPPPPPPPPAYVPPPPPPAPVFRSNEFAWSTARGANALTGRVSYHPRPGERWTCAGQLLRLVPDTRYSRERLGRLYGSAEEAAAPVGLIERRSAGLGRADYEPFVRRTTCSAQGRFAFRDLPDGSYLLLALVKPVRPKPHQEDVAILQRVTVQGGFVKTIVVPRPPGA